jgi:endonuclease/exonuclease/phosphatase family metal-dependent hydrolase
MTRIRIATWNVWWRFGDPERRRPAVLAALRDLDPDVVGLQEVWSRGGQNLAAGLAAELGYQVAFAAAPDASPWTGRVPGGAAYGIGNAVLSRWPLRAAHAEVLPSAGGPAAQVLLQVLADTPAGTLPVATTHLTPDMTGSALRMEQVRAIARHVAAGPAGDLPPVVLGDFNAEPASDEMRLLEGHLTAPAVPGLLLADTRRWAPDADDATWRPDNPHVGARGDPASRVDHVLVGLGRGSVPVSVARVGLFATRGWPGPEGEVWPSDHAGVVVDLRAGP